MNCLLSSNSIDAPLPLPKRSRFATEASTLTDPVQPRECGLLPIMPCLSKPPHPEGVPCLTDQPPHPEGVPCQTTMPPPPEGVTCSKDKMLPEQSHSTTNSPAGHASSELPSPAEDVPTKPSSKDYTHHDTQAATTTASETSTQEDETRLTAASHTDQQFSPPDKHQEQEQISAATMTVEHPHAAATGEFGPLPIMPRSYTDEAAFAPTSPADTMVTQPESDDMNIAAVAQQAAEAQTQVVMVLGPQTTMPVEIRVTQGATAGQLIVAEDKLGSLHHPIAPRSWVHTHLPLNGPIHEQNLIVLHQNPPDDSKCPVHHHPSAQPKLPFPCTRMEALRYQQAWVAPDEMEFYLTAAEIESLALPFQPHVFDNNAAALEWGWDWLEIPATNTQDTKPWVSAAMICNHWIPVILQGDPDNLELLTTRDGQVLYEVLTTSMPDHQVTLKTMILPEAFNADCGFQTFAWIMGYLLNPQDFVPEPLPSHRAAKWRNLFANNLWLQDKHLTRIHSLPLGGTKTDQAAVHAQISELLAQHGVWPDRVQDRTNQLMAKLPATVAKTIVQSPKAWADLKAAANQLQPAFKLVLTDELNTQIAQRVKQRKFFGKPGKGEKAKSNQAAPPTVRAADLSIPTGVFKQQDGQQLATIHHADIGPTAKGVLLVDQEDANATLKLPTPLTPHGLAVIVIATSQNEAQHQIEAIRFPAMCNLTQEPMIISGYLYQKGQVAVERAKPAQLLAVEEQQAEAVRCLVFKDQADAIWSDLQKSPVKTVFQQEPLLQRQDGTQAPVIDVWSREWMSKRFEKVKPHQADMFTFSFRVLSQHHDALLAKSGSNGVYYEPRSQCGRFPSTQYHVTWLQNMTFQDAKYAQQTSPQTTTLVRHIDRYGLRSDPMNASAIHTKHRPDTPLLMGNTKQLYSVGPMPFATTKEALVKILKVWDWEARPLHPKGRSQDGTGINWTIQATEDPKFWVYSLQHGDVLITRLQDAKPVQGQQPYSIVASKKTLVQLQHQGPDPWLQADPWKPTTDQNRRPVGPSIAATGATPAQLAALEQSLEQKLLAAIHTHKGDGDVSMDNAGMEHRVTTMENQLQQLQSNQQGMDSKISQIQIQVEHQAQRFESSLDSKLQDQMDRIEHLMRKRAHHE